MSLRTERISEQTWSPLAASGPPARWTAMRKAMVVRAILAGKLDGLAARLRFDLADEELSGWISRYVEHGVKGLRTTRLQNYRTRTADQNSPRRGRPRKFPADAPGTDHHRATKAPARAGSRK
jgi:Protein of unknown function (DUF1153)